MRIRDAIHSARPRHERLMALALSHVERAQYWQREALRDNSIYERSEAMTAGFACLRVAIKLVVDCGCARELWPLKVQDFIVDTDSEKGAQRNDIR